MNFKTNVPYLNNQALEIVVACMLLPARFIYYFQQNYCTIFALNCVFFFSANEKGSHYNAIKWKLKFVSGSFVPKSYL